MNRRVETAVVKARAGWLIQRDVDQCAFFFIKEIDSTCHHFDAAPYTELRRLSAYSTRPHARIVGTAFLARRVDDPAHPQSRPINDH